jgi:transposase-like protein
MNIQTPISFFEFTKKFNNEEACREHLFHLRWPDGFICPKCSNDSYYKIEKRHLFQCKACRHQTTVTAGTIMDKTHIKLEKWFWAIYLVSTDKRGHSAKALERELNIGYKSAWYLLQRIRTAMAEQESKCILSGIIEVDDAFFGAADDNGKRGRGTSKTQVVIGLTLNEKGNPGYLKMEIVKDLTSDTVAAFAEANIESGSTISTDAYKSFNQFKRDGYNHLPKVFEPKEDKDHLKWLHTIVSNVKAFINGTFHGLDEKHLQFYLAEFCYRFNRRFHIDTIFNKLLASCSASQKISFAELTA